MKKDAKEKNINISKKVQEYKNKRLVGLIILLATIVLIVVLFFATGVYKVVFEFFGFEVEREYTAEGITVSFNPSGEYKISAADETIIVFDEKGVTGYDNEGVWKWHNDIKYVDPVLESYEDFVLVHDRESKKVAMFNSSGAVWSKTFSFSIRCAIVHEKTSFISVITDSDEYNSEIYIIDYKNNSKDIFCGKFVDEYLVSASISPDCSQFVLSGMYSEGEKTMGTLMFLRMSDGEIFSTEISEHIYPYVEYSDNDTLVAANSDSLITVSKQASIDTKKDKITTLWSREYNSDMLLGIDTVVNEGFAVSFGSGDVNSEKSTVNCYDKNGQFVKKLVYDQRIHYVNSHKDNFIFSSDEAVYWISKTFKEKCKYTSLSDVQHAEFINDTRVLVQMKSRLMIIAFSEKE